MNYKTLLFILFSFSIFCAKANSLTDSIGVENLNGKKLILHKVEPKETYYSIGRRYGISPQVIMEYNKSVALHPSDIIKVPTQTPFTNPPTSFSSPPKKENEPVKKEINHKVAQGETLYGIASKYNMRVDDLKLLNGLKNNSLSVGQTLKVVANDKVSLTQEVAINDKGKPEVATDNKPIKSDKIKYLDSVDSQNTLEIPKNRYGITEMNDKGLAVWIDDNNLDATKSYALHRTAPVGTIIKITNPMTNRSVFAKVVGRFTENETTKDVIIVVTKATAEAIGALDKRFLVNITFGLPNEN
ncbi:LysM peptidoglycan-binding domain-containing protein [Pedobacter sp. SD-b]|uniref:LysM peptidoglycan-binding domain-containing protein n=2 Tax=Pedobacter segetis TaxID=2793069 RepID=A0ABS1BJJ0_9SPHI|nr:LysM peptidoglycan-binding domain-containing protein [Pedobacter segetis]